MDFRLNEEQELFVAGIKDYMSSRNWESYFAECDEKHQYPIEWVKGLAELGVDTMLLDEEHGGMGANMVTLTAIWEELGRLGGPTYVLYQLPGFGTILRHGTKEQIDKVFAYRGSGEQMFNSAITEPSAGSDVGSLKSTYERRNGKIYLNGQKCFITSSLHCPYLIVMAKDASSQTPVYSEFFIDVKNVKGEIKITPLDKLGLRMDSCCEITFNEVQLEEKDFFGKEGKGFERVKEEFDAERFLVAVTNYATAYCAFEDACKYANLRVQFKEAIGRTQLIQEKIAFMAMKLNAMKNMVYECAWKMDNNIANSGDSAMCKYFCANEAFYVVDTAIQILGGIGVTGHRTSRFWRDLRIDRLSGGSDEMQILTLGRAILKQYR
ncbi:crotonobetainyl-CoA dehydrogenase [Campylobacter canadensis]|uniref:crotonobetainyl-CoA dehydrogenase n=2 Tax=Campylobacter canadensis TaxID=449520 RepID=UPI001CCA13F9|nr:crotonobetainyl-CoA dehydrogenase [Campylobacter canadensis]MBZ7994430.1 crotonobetainyl-CoA dehydrogenase [Campylobacter canadensis]MBZ7996483.1 crotonobetainyl-CoA dehydrogenase [Campylobacter canadensis]MBZ7999855.1 crotonobetainyl-CoA dehydrogenase [Campylobacter canadensis]MBZ8001664.1 crotonobetainyl-CoA dehydrogenase [Campylobacter canadensis]MBZ8002989.1 crotonobetainyl-CoA dehydrogenase [Campylobacter canadensis]